MSEEVVKKVSFSEPDETLVEDEEIAHDEEWENAEPFPEQPGRSEVICEEDVCVEVKRLDEVPRKRDSTTSEENGTYDSLIG